MPELGDVVLAGLAYTVDPKTYIRTTDGEQEGQVERWVMRDFLAGQHRAIQLEREAAWDGLDVGPAWQGQGVEPWPRREVYVDAAILPVSTTQQAFSTQQGGYTLIAVGRYLYRSVAAGVTWADVANIHDRGAGFTATGIATIQTHVAVAYGANADVRAINVSTGATVTTYTGEKWKHIVHYAGTILGSDTANAKRIRVRVTSTVFTDIDLDTAIAAMSLHDGRIAVATQTSLYLLAGQPVNVNPGGAADWRWSQDPVPMFTHGNISEPDQDYQFLVSFSGRLWTWLGREIVEYDPNAGGMNRQGWKRSGIEGQKAYGATVAGGYLIVCLKARDGGYETWAHDGAGWWKIRRTESTANLFPTALGDCGEMDLLTFHDGDASVAYSLQRLNYRGTTKTTYPTTESTYTTPMLHMDAPDAIKSWRQIGASFATPEPRGNSASTDSVSIALKYSIDGGATWTTCQSASPNAGSVRLHELLANLASNVATSRYIQIRVTWGSVTDWAPVLQSLWVEYARLDGPAKRRAWRMTVTPADPSILRDGSVDARSAATQLADLWNAWANGTTITLRDIDYDLVPTQRNVRVRSIVEERTTTRDAARWTTPQIEIQLIEV